MSRELRVAHHSPGRLRLRSRAFEEDGAKELVERASSALRSVSGVNDVSVSGYTGSVLVLYDPEKVAQDTLVATVAGATRLPVAERKHRPGDEEHPIDVAIDAVRSVNEFTSELTGHRADLRFLVPAALAGAGVYALVTSEEPILPRWETLLYWAYAVFSNVNGPEIDRRTREVIAQ
jgi:hypothetical protein